MSKEFEIRPDKKAGHTYEIVQAINGILICACISDLEDAQIMCEAMNRNPKELPVIDADKLAEKLWEAGLTELTVNSYVEFDGYSPSAKRIIEGTLKKIADLLTSNLDLRVDWVDGRSRWGIFKLGISADHPSYMWTIYTKDGAIVDEGDCKSQELAEAACIDALKRIITGQKE